MGVATVAADLLLEAWMNVEQRRRRVVNGFLHSGYLHEADPRTVLPDDVSNTRVVAC
jgi:hypothetical protein